MIKIFNFVYLFFYFIFTKIFFYRARLIRLPIYLRGDFSGINTTGFTTGPNCRIENYSTNKSSLTFGKNCQLNDNVHIACYKCIKIGNNVLIASRVFITDHNHGNYSDEHPSSPLTIPAQRPIYPKKVVIGDNVWIGEGVVILPGVTIGNGVVIGSNSVVTKDLPENTICIGVPAKPVKVFNFSTNKWEKYQYQKVGEYRDP